MKALIVDDDLTSRTLLNGILQAHGTCDVAVNGHEAVAAVKAAVAERAPYHLVCLDIMMPELDGQATLKAIRALEASAGIAPGRGAKVIMTSGLRDSKNILTAFKEQCDAYLPKPFDRPRLVEHLRRLALIP